MLKRSFGRQPVCRIFKVRKNFASRENLLLDRKEKIVYIYNNIAISVIVIKIPDVE
jgi:hypothetical protein